MFIFFVVPWQEVKKLTTFVALKRARGGIMTLDSSVPEYLPYMQNRKPAASHIFMCTLFQKRKIIQENNNLLIFNQ